jgi:hypothetical protein
MRFASIDCLNDGTLPRRAWFGTYFLKFAGGQDRCGKKGLPISAAHPFESSSGNGVREAGVSVIRVGGIRGGASRTCRGGLIPPVSLSSEIVTLSWPQRLQHKKGLEGWV